jgi:hypothetical protein
VVFKGTSKGVSTCETAPDIAENLDKILKILGPYLNNNRRTFDRVLRVVNHYLLPYSKQMENIAFEMTSDYFMPALCTLSSHKDNASFDREVWNIMKKMPFDKRY